MFLHTQGELALGSRFKAVSEALYGIANEVYRSVGVKLDAHTFPLLRYLQVKGPAAVTTIALQIGQTHSAVSQLATKLARDGWLARKADADDARRSVLELTAKGEANLANLGPVWCAIRRGVAAAAQRGAGSLLGRLGGFEADIASGRMLREILAAHDRLKVAKVEIKPFRKEWREHFYRINAQWLERWFEIEPVDRVVLTQPEAKVIEPGGAILFALLDGEVIGTGALLKEAPGVYELTKMCVEPGFRGNGAGRVLLEAAMAEFHKRRGKTLFLESNSGLTPALKLYQSVGFVLQPKLRTDSHYWRADVYMVYQAKAAGRSGRPNPRRAKKRH